MPTTASAPGKALIAGGYLVLERPNIGLVLASSARFFSTVAWKAAEAAARPQAAGDTSGSDTAAQPPAAPAAGDDADERLFVRVVSPQFGQRLCYRLGFESGGEGLRLSSTTERGGGGGGNSYVEHTITHTLAAVCALRGYTSLRELLAGAAAAAAARGEEGCAAAAGEPRELSIELRADNDFYSQSRHLSARGLPLSAGSLRQLPRFLPCPVDGATGAAVVAKTGMGSSAALITSLVAALLAFFDAQTAAAATAAAVGGGGAAVAEYKATVHAVAQACHAMAQGKVGSGFDVCAAVHGCNGYVRFSKSLLQVVLDAPETAAGTAAPVPPARLGGCVGGGALSAWDHEVAPFALPPCLELLMGDVCGGSETPSMVRKILGWRDGGAGAEGDARRALWAALGAANCRVRDGAAALHAASEADGESYAAHVGACENFPNAAWAMMGGRVGELLLELRRAFEEARSLLRRMGEGADVPVEPPAQLALCDATAALPGVLACGVPGAGGYDAVFAIVLGGAAAAGRVEALWASWDTATGAVAAGAGASGGGGGGGGGGGAVVPLLLRVDQGAGVRIEDDEVFGVEVAKAEAAAAAFRD